MLKSVDLISPSSTGFWLDVHIDSLPWIKDSSQYKVITSVSRKPQKPLLTCSFHFHMYA